MKIIYEDEEIVVKQSEKDFDFMPNAGLGLTPQKIYFRAKEKDFIMDFRQAAHM